MKLRLEWIIGGLAGLTIGLGGAVAVDAARGETDNYDAASQLSVRQQNAVVQARIVPHQKFVKAVEQRRAADRQVRALRRSLAHSPSVQEALTLASITYGISRSDLSSTAWCESRHVAAARNGQYVGIMQLGNGFRSASPFFPALDPWSPYANIMAAAHVIRDQGYRQWQCRPGGKLAW